MNMKKIIKNLFCLLLITILLCACSGRKTVIGVSQCCGGKWREKVNNEMRLALYQYKDAEAVFKSAENDGNRQSRQIDSLVAQHVDLLVVAPDNVNDVTPAIERAYRKGIPVILYDRKIKSPCYNAYIGGDNVEAGRTVARFMAEKLQGKGTIVEITGLKNTSPVIERHRGFMEVMKKYPSIRVVTLDSDWTLEKAQDVFGRYLDKGGHADGIFGHNDLCAIGGKEAAIARHQDKQLVVVGIDGLPGEWEGVDRVKRGYFAASYVYPTKGEEVVALAMKILKGEPYKKENYLKSFLATSENCDAILLQYQDLETKVRDMDHISNGLISSQQVAHVQRWVILIAVIVVVALLFIIYYIYKVYKRKLQKLKIVARTIIEQQPEEMPAELSQLDESERYFIDRFKKKVVEHMGDANLKMDDLGAEMSLSKVQLYRKVKAMTGKTPAELLKEMRLQRAYTLLKQTDKTISEVSTEVGFAVPGYFSTCFKKQFGILPTEMRQGE